MGRLELPSPKAHAPEACVFTNFTTSANSLNKLRLQSPSARFYKLSPITRAGFMA